MPAATVAVIGGTAQAQPSEHLINIFVLLGLELFTGNFEFDRASVTGVLSRYGQDRVMCLPLSTPTIEDRRRR